MQTALSNKGFTLILCVIEHEFSCFIHLLISYSRICRRTLDYDPSYDFSLIDFQSLKPHSAAWRINKTPEIELNAPTLWSFCFKNGMNNFRHVYS